MPGDRSSQKKSGKPARQLLFSEALLQTKGPPSTPATQPPATHHDVTDSALESPMHLEAHASSILDRDQELLFLCSQLADLEDRSRRDNVCFLGFPENIEGEDLHGFLRDTLPRMIGTTFDPPLEFQ
ncbi:hypothetical protein NDU88_006811 [Pleurodeles waltl]|uniref:Uncharacterized protein n=1 Tax=Pleurodeles waltl TaxID=8319 RepID=A0AAV7X2R0_PLEWA|nr:hypothetical protein NDU88_006811 [Pleurodeles waltl]